MKVKCDAIVGFMNLHHLMTLSAGDASETYPAFINLYAYVAVDKRSKFSYIS